MVTGNAIKGAQSAQGAQMSNLPNQPEKNAYTSPLDGLDPAADYDYSGFYEDEGCTLAPAPAKPFFRSASLNDAAVPCVDILAALEWVRLRRN